VLSEQAERLQASLDAVGRLVDDLALDELQPSSSDEPDAGGVVVRHEEPRLVLAVEGSPRLEDLGAFVGRCEALLHEAAMASGAVVEGCFGASYPPPLDDGRQEVVAFLPISAPVLVAGEHGSVGVRVDELPPCDVAVLELRGSYVGLEACYRRLGTWVAFHATPADLPVRELYLTPVGTPVEEPVTELLWPVVADEAR
jgi:hypothetical protein